jgi:hypothetical protein
MEAWRRLHASIRFWTRLPTEERRCEQRISGNGWVDHKQPFLCEAHGLSERERAFPPERALTVSV